MANTLKHQLLRALTERFGRLRRLPNSQSLFVVGDDAARIYVRYSKLHSKTKAFFGLRDVDLQQLEGHNSFICYLTDTGSDPLFVPYVDFEETFHIAQPAEDGQYKVQLILHADSRELYIARQGRFNLEGYVGFEPIERTLESTQGTQPPDLSHQQVQTLLAGIGHAKGYDVYVPPRDAATLDWSLTNSFTLREVIPPGFGDAAPILAEIDVLWITAGRSDVQGLFEVEHSTPVYSGLLRLNDALLTEPRLTRFVIASNDTRRDLFSRQAHRPTFRKSGLAERASFLDYANVFAWHCRVSKSQ